MLISDLREFLDREERETSADEIMPTRLARVLDQDALIAKAQ